MQIQISVSVQSLDEPLQFPAPWLACEIEINIVAPLIGPLVKIKWANIYGAAKAHSIRFIADRTPITIITMATTNSIIFIDLFSSFLDICFLPRASAPPPRRLPYIQAENSLHLICLFLASRTRTEQIACSACGWHDLSFLPCELLKGREESVSLQAHLHLFSACSL